MALLLVAALATSAPVDAGHEEGREINVAMLACVIDRQAPHRMDVVASSVNLTHNPIPIISRHHSCAQNMHQLLTAGFEIEQASLENLVFVFLLTREDESTHQH